METLRGILIKNMPQKYASNLHKRVPDGAFPHKFNTFSFHYNTDSVGLFSVT